jgi:energy-converting hydrogenase Eha subunit G
MKMQMIQFVSGLNSIRTKLMKIMYIAKNILSKEFQHFAESQLIEVMNMKMHMIEMGETVLSFKFVHYFILISSPSTSGSMGTVANGSCHRVALLEWNHNHDGRSIEGSGWSAQSIVDETDLAEFILN